MPKPIASSSGLFYKILTLNLARTGYPSWHMDAIPLLQSIMGQRLRGSLAKSFLGKLEEVQKYRGNSKYADSE
jgi:hypothetical protein